VRAQFGAKSKRIDLECESKDDATLLFAALSILIQARKSVLGIGEDKDD
jgi:hypothetical protein